MTSKCPLDAARWSGVQPLSSWVFRFALNSTTRSFTMSIFPWFAARPKEVEPHESRASTSAFSCRRINLTALRLPVREARNRLDSVGEELEGSVSWVFQYLKSHSSYF